MDGVGRKYGDRTRRLRRRRRVRFFGGSYNRQHASGDCERDREQLDCDDDQHHVGVQHVDGHFDYVHRYNYDNDSAGRYHYVHRYDYDDHSARDHDGERHRGRRRLSAPRPHVDRRPAIICELVSNLCGASPDGHHRRPVGRLGKGCRLQ
jgi:hypothetical protein